MLLGTGQAGGMAGGTAEGLASTGCVNPLPFLPSEILMQRASLLAEVALLQQQNSELCLLLEEYISSGVSAASPPPLQPGDIPPCVPHAEFPDMGATAWSPSVSGSGCFSPQVNSKLLSPPTKWMDLNLSCPGEAQWVPRARARLFSAPS